MKTSELSGYLLDYWTGKALGKNVKIIKHQREDSYFCVEMIEYPGFISASAPRPEPKEVLYNPSEDWSIGGPLVEEYCPGAQKLIGEWESHHGLYGPTLLIVTCLGIVKFKFGNEVPDEGEK